MHDQTVYYLNRGFTPGEMMDLITLPPHLAASPYLQETYGSMDWNIYHIFRYYRGYYTGAIRDLYPQSALSEAQMSAELAGGIGSLAMKAENALLAGNLEWALRLADDVLLLEPGNTLAFETKKAALLALAENTMNSQARNMLLSEYLIMTNQVYAPFPFGNPKEIYARMSDNAVVLMPMNTLHRIMAVSLNASKSMDTEVVVDLQLTDISKNQNDESAQFTLWVRKGILEVDSPIPSNAQFEIVTDSLTWKGLVLGKITPEVAVTDGQVLISGGEIEDFYAFMNLFN
jgi:alkyl sulfatase BDS1-like metallo-beta-lactamase superfamily hydrolase